jgi:hypothetical protein
MILTNHKKNSRLLVDENVAQVVECLYGKHKDLSSNPHTAKKKRKCKTLNVYELKRVGRDGVEVV